MAAPLRLFWWSPRRMPRTGWQEMKTHWTGWSRIAIRNARFLTNFGDELSPLVAEAVTGRQIRWAPPRSAALFAAGSILDFVVYAEVSGAQVWGAGLRDGEPSHSLRDGRAEILAVRGPLTSAAVGCGLDVPIGDPGLLVPRIVDAAPVLRGVSFLPHFSAWASRAGREELKAARDSGMRILLPSGRPRSVAREISRSELLLTSSLHGLILAHAYGVPVVPLRHDGFSEPKFKFQDHCAAIGTSYEPLRLANMLDSKARLAVAKDAAELVDRLQRRAKELADGLAVSARGIA